MIGVTREALNPAVARFHGQTLLLRDNHAVDDLDVEQFV